MKNEKHFGVYLIFIFVFFLGTALGYGVAYLSGVTPSYIPLLSAVIGLVVAFSIPFWQALFVNPPRLSVEINSIRRTVSDTAVIAIDDDPELRTLKPIAKMPTFFPMLNIGDVSLKNTRPKRGYTLAESEELVADAKRRLRELPSQIEERKKDFDRVNNVTLSGFTRYEADRLNRPLSPEVKYDDAAPEKTLEELKKAYEDRLSTLEKSYADLQSNLPAIERRLEFLKRELVDNRSYFTVSASLINSGRANTAIKVPSLLRVSIGEGNYIDLKLSLKDFEDRSEISASGTRIVIFESSEISSLPEEDRKLIATYWGQSVSSRLFLEDIHSNAYASNTIAFAEGLYQKIIYDRLAAAASTFSK